MVDVGRRSLAEAEAQRQAQVSRSEALRLATGGQFVNGRLVGGTTIIPLEPKGVRIPRFAGPPGVFDVRLKRFLTVREVVQRRVTQLVKKGGKTLATLTPPERLELKKLSTTLQTTRVAPVTRTEVQASAAAGFTPTRKTQALSRERVSIETKISSLNQQAKDLNQRRINLENALKQIEAGGFQDINKAAVINLAIQKLNKDVSDFEKRRVGVEKSKKSFGEEVKTVIPKKAADLLTSGIARELKIKKELEKFEEKRPITFFEGVPFTGIAELEEGGTLFQEVRVPKKKEPKRIAPPISFRERQRQITESFAAFGADIAPGPLKTGAFITAGGIGLAIGTAEAAIAKGIDVGLFGIESFVGKGKPIEFIATGRLARQIELARKIPFISTLTGAEETEVLAPGFVRFGRPAIREFLTSAAFFFGPEAVAAAARAARVTKVVKVPKKVKAPKVPSIFDVAIGKEKLRLLEAKDVFKLPTRPGIVPGAIRKAIAAEEKAIAALAKPPAQFFTKAELARIKAQQIAIQKIGVPIEVAKVGTKQAFQQAFLKTLGVSERAEFAFGRVVEPTVTRLTRAELKARLVGLRGQAELIRAGRAIRVGAQQAALARRFAFARGLTEIDLLFGKAARPVTRTKAQIRVLALRTQKEIREAARAAQAVSTTAFRLGIETFVGPPARVAKRAVSEIELARLRAAAQVAKGKTQAKLFARIKKIEAENILAQFRLGVREEIRLPLAFEIRKFVVPLAERKKFQITKQFLEKEAKQNIGVGFFRQTGESLRSFKIKEVVPNIEQTLFFKQLAKEFFVTEKELGRILSKARIVSTSGATRSPIGEFLFGSARINKLLKKPTVFVNVKAGQQIPFTLKHELAHIVQFALRKKILRSKADFELQAQKAELFGERRIIVKAPSIEEEILFFGRRRIRKAKKEIARPFARIEQEKQLAVLLGETAAKRIVEKGIGIVAPPTARIELAVQAPLKRIRFELGVTKFKRIPIIQEPLKIPVKKPKPIKPLKKVSPLKITDSEFFRPFPETPPSKVQFPPPPIRGRRGRQILIFEEELAVSRFAPKEVRFPLQVPFLAAGVIVGDRKKLSDFEKFGLKDLAGFTSALIPSGRSFERLRDRFRIGVGISPRTEQFFKIREEERIMERERQVPLIRFGLRTGLGERIGEITGLKEITVPRVTKKPRPPPPIIIGLPEIEPPELILAPPKKVPGFFAMVKARPFRKKKFVKVSKALSMEAALQRGLRVADITIAQSVRLVKSKKKVKRQRPPLIDLRSKFRKKGNVFIEKRRFAIDTLTEKQDLSVAKFLAQEKKRGLSFFGVQPRRKIKTKRRKRK